MNRRAAEVAKGRKVKFKNRIPVLIFSASLRDLCDSAVKYFPSPPNRKVTLNIRTGISLRRENEKCDGHPSPLNKLCRDEQTRRYREMIKAMGYSNDEANEAIRLSWCHLTPEVEWEAVAGRILSLS